MSVLRGRCAQVQNRALALTRCSFWTPKSDHLSAGHTFWAVGISSKILGPQKRSSRLCETHILRFHHFVDHQLYPIASRIQSHFCSLSVSCEKSDHFCGHVQKSKIALSPRRGAHFGLPKVLISRLGTRFGPSEFRRKCLVPQKRSSRLCETHILIKTIKNLSVFA